MSKFLNQTEKKFPDQHKDRKLLDDAVYRRLVQKNYLTLSCQIFPRQAENLLHQIASLYSPGQQNFEELRNRPMRKKNDLLKVKMTLDYFHAKKPELGEIAKFYFLLLEEEYQKEVKKNRFKEPFNFILKVPFSQWTRYKTSFLPKPRFIGGIAKSLDPKSVFRLIKVKKRRPKKPVRPRGYRDKGNLASQDSVARRKASEEAEKIRMFLWQVQRRYAYNQRRFTDPVKARRQTLREVKKILNMHPKTTLVAVEQHLRNLRGKLRG